MISNLRINVGKCVVVPLWHYQEKNVKNLLKELVPKWADFCVAGYAKYLGFFIGPGAGLLSIEKAMTKYKEACRFIKALHQPAFASVLMYRMFAVSSIQFVTQILPLPNSFKKDELSGMVKLFSVPWNSVSKEFLYHLTANKCFPLNFPSLEVVAFSASARTLMHTLPHWEQHLGTITSARAADDAKLVHPFQDWLKNSFAFHLRKVADVLEHHKVIAHGAGRCRVINHEILQALRDHSSKQVQKTIGNLFLQICHPFDLKQYLAHKFGRWYDSSVACAHACTAVKVLDNLHGKVPPCVLHAVITTWLNAWHTDARYQKEPRPCVLSRHCKGKDTLEHYVVCPTVWNTIFSKLRAKNVPRSRDRFFLLDPSHKDDIVILACIVYSVRRTVHKFRARNDRVCEEESKRYLWEAVKIAAAHNAHTAKIIKSKWIA